MSKEELALLWDDSVRKKYLDKVLQIERENLVAVWLQDEKGGSISYDRSGHAHHGEYTGVNLGQAGVPGMPYSSAGYDGAASFNNIHSAGFAGDNELSNGGFETAGGGGADIWADWTENAGDGALANEAVIVHQGVGACKQTSGVTSNTYCAQNVVVVPGERRRLRIWSRGDGVNAGRYYVYDLTNAQAIIATTSTGITAAAWEMLAVEYTVPAGCVSIRKALRCPPVNGGVCYFDACEDRPKDAFCGDKGTIIVPAQVASAGVWTDGITRFLVNVRVDASNYIQITKNLGANTISFLFMSGGVLEFSHIAGMTTTDFFWSGITWDASAGANGEVRYYLDGVPTGAMDTGIGTWLGDLDNNLVCIGAASTVPADIFDGNIGPVPHWNKALTPTQMLEASMP